MSQRASTSAPVATTARMASSNDRALPVCSRMRTSATRQNSDAAPVGAAPRVGLLQALVARLRQSLREALRRGRARSSRGAASRARTRASGSTYDGDPLREPHVLVRQSDGITTWISSWVMTQSSRVVAGGDPRRQRGRGPRAPRRRASRRAWGRPCRASRRRGCVAPGRSDGGSRRSRRRPSAPSSRRPRRRVRDRAGRSRRRLVRCRS